MYSTVAWETAAAWIMSWLVALLFETPPTRLPQLNRVCACYLGHGLKNKCTHAHTHTHTHIHTESSVRHIHTINLAFTLGCALYSPEPMTFHINISIFQSPLDSLFLCVWRGRVLILALILACSSVHVPFSASTLSTITVNQSRSGHLQLSPPTLLLPL